MKASMCQDQVLDNRCWGKHQGPCTESWLLDGDGASVRGNGWRGKFGKSSRPLGHDFMFQRLKQLIGICRGGVSKQHLHVTCK